MKCVVISSLPSIFFFPEVLIKEFKCPKEIMAALTNIFFECTPFPFIQEVETSF